MDERERSAIGPVDDSVLLGMSASDAGRRASRGERVGRQADELIERRRKEGHPLPWRSDVDRTDLTFFTGYARLWRRLHRELERGNAERVRDLSSERIEYWRSKVGGGAPRSVPPTSSDPEPKVLQWTPRRPPLPPKRG